ncbi:hypothetical protein ME1_01433 [Bartonella vinsonii subsp. arupensis OK-94-513]|uniref:Uncharacterized protein n=1 Tax=Bartonella vinsonii subsp. arupensis OK-94-513 TaxID=1094562 RepID=J0QJU7_BARVI|nr:hypothetical protein ME1_01433 [Bartonella vinsonii subsp. arupensis OK-94-513]
MVTFFFVPVLLVLVAENCREKEFKKDKKLRLEWEKKCYLGGTSMHTSQNCENAVRAGRQLLLGG